MDVGGRGKIGQAVVGLISLSSQLFHNTNITLYVFNSFSRLQY